MPYSQIVLPMSRNALMICSHARTHRCPINQNNTHACPEELPVHP